MPINDQDNQRRDNAQNAMTIRRELANQQRQINNEADRIIADVHENRQRGGSAHTIQSVNLISFDDPQPNKNQVEGKYRCN